MLRRGAPVLAFLVAGGAGLGAAAWADSGSSGGGGDDTTITVGTETDGHEGGDGATTIVTTTPAAPPAVGQAQQATRAGLPARAIAQPSHGATHPLQLQRRSAPTVRRRAATPIPRDHKVQLQRTNRASSAQKPVLSGPRATRRGSEQSLVSPADRPADRSTVVGFLSPSVARWTAVFAGAVVIFVLVALAAGLWAKSQLPKL